jgi:hypothetical protein
MLETPVGHWHLSDAILEGDGVVPAEVQALGGLLYEMEPVRLSPIPGVLDPASRLHAVIARPEVGKTSLGFWMGQRWCEGRPAWEGCPDLPGSQVLVISREPDVRQIDSLLQRFAHFGTTGVWEDRIHIVARDPELSADLKPLLTLDQKGRGLLEQLLREAKDTGDPIGLVVLDSLSRLKPDDVDENDNNAMYRWLDRLDAIAQAHSVYILLIHHAGHGGEGRSADPKSAGRGASAIGAVTSAQLLLERAKDRRQRILKVEGNFVLGGDITFEVCGPEAHENAIHYFTPIDPYAVYDPVKLVGQEAISTNQLAWRLSGEKPEPGKTPPGTATRLATKLRNYWLAKGVIEVFDGPRGAKMLQLKGDLATSPSPRQNTGAKSGESDLATSPPLYKGGEVGVVPGALTTGCQSLTLVRGASDDEGGES